MYLLFEQRNPTSRWRFVHEIPYLDPTLRPLLRKNEIFSINPLDPFRWVSLIRNGVTESIAGLWKDNLELPNERMSHANHAETETFVESE